MKPCAVLIAFVTVGMGIRHITLFPEHIRNRIREYAPALVIPGHCELNRGRPRRAWCPSLGLHYVPSLKKAQFAPGTRVYSAHICSLVNTPLTSPVVRSYNFRRRIMPGTSANLKSLLEARCGWRGRAPTQDRRGLPRCGVNGIPRSARLVLLWRNYFCVILRRIRRR